MPEKTSLTSENRYRIAIVGAGAWGSALACIAAENGHQVVLWGRRPEVVEEIRSQRTNRQYLPADIRLHSAIEPTTDVAQVNHAEIIVLAVPTQYIRPLLQNYPFDLRDRLIVNVAKGIEIGTHRRISEILLEEALVDLDHYVVLTGPSHAEEVCRRAPTTVVSASLDLRKAEIVQQIFSTPFFRVYTSHDVVGAEMGGALKNVIALAAGMVDGLRLGSNAKAALMTRGLAEMSRLGVAMGANPLTFSGLSGLGDLIVTCISQYSRNRRIGELIGTGLSLDEALRQIPGVAEGVSTVQAVKELATQYHIEMPISSEIYAILFQGKSPHQAITDLMTRDAKPELWGIA